MKVVIALMLIASNFAFAASPKFNKDNKMKPNEVFKKCGEWAKKETEKVKDEKARQKDFLSKAHSCALNNGFDAKGDEGNEMWIKYGRR